MKLRHLMSSPVITVMEFLLVLCICIKTIAGMIREQTFITSKEKNFTECSEGFPAFSVQHCVLECMSTCKYPGPRIWRKENKTCICCGCAFPGITMNLTNSSGSSIIGYTPLPEPCIENYKLFFNGSEVACLRYEITTVDYSSALSDCRSEGGDLIKINSQSKNEFILKYIEFYGDLTLDVWLQGKLFNTSCIWVFEDDTEITFNFWNNREPKCDLDQPRKRARADRGFQWFDKVSSAAYPYLCEMNPFL